ncbi:MAG: 30S ribosomal protein S4 [Candidatus Aureabacteria bacterium]|nr:30S ribosomal protein S4 [Candidatus Auribacterota bacterium]
MARYTGPVCRLCRQEGMKLFLKGSRCEMAKCAIDRGRQAPGMHVGRRRKQSAYAEQLREKQRLRRIYGVLEKQFRIMFQRALKRRGITGDNLLKLLEARLDNVVFRLGFASSRAQARQMVNHGFFTIRQRTVTIPSYQVKAGEVIQVKPMERYRKAVAKHFEETEKRAMPAWLSLNKGEFNGEVLRMPERADITLPVNEQLVVELYSK